MIDPPAPLALACARLGEAMEPGETEGLSCRRISPVLSSAGEGLPRAYLVELTLPAGPDRVFVLTFESSDGVEFFFEVGDEPWDMGTTQTRGLTGMRFLQVFEGGSEELLVEWRVSSHIGEDYEIVDDEMRPLEWITDTTEAFVALCTFDEAIPKCRALQTRRRILHAEKRDGRFTSRRTDHGVSLEWLPDRRVRITADGDDAGPLAPLLGAHLWPDLPRLPTSE